MSKDDDNESGGGVADLVAGIIIGIGAAAAAVTAGAAYLARKRARSSGPVVWQSPIKVEEIAGDERADDVPRVGGGDRGFN
jgi:hypothetical protein